MSNCYSCKHRQNVPGDCHSSCGHPVHQNGEMAMGIAMAIMIQDRSALAVIKDATGLSFNPHGVQNGWCSFPMNYDPSWVQGECKLFNKIEVETIS